MERPKFIITGKDEDKMEISVHKDSIIIEMEDEFSYFEMIVTKNTFYQLIDKLQKLRDDQDGTK